MNQLALCLAEYLEVKFYFEVREDSTMDLRKEGALEFVKGSYILGDLAKHKCHYLISWIERFRSAFQVEEHRATLDSWNEQAQIELEAHDGDRSRLDALVESCESEDGFLRVADLFEVHLPTMVYREAGGGKLDMKSIIGNWERA